MPEYKTLRLSDVEVDYSIQPRVNGLNQDHVDELEAAYRDENAAIEPPVAWQLPDESYKLSQGFHRVEGAKRAGRESLKFVVRKGTDDECAIDAFCSNQSHGLKRTNADKRRAVERLLKLMPKDSDLAIANRAGVSDKTVAEARREMMGRSEIPNVETRTDTKGREQPASKPRAVATKPTESASPDSPASSEPPPSANHPETPDGSYRTPVVNPAVETVMCPHCLGAGRIPKPKPVANLYDAPGMPPLPGNLDTGEFILAWESWLQDRKKRGKKVQPNAATLQLRDLSVHGPRIAIEAIETSIKNGWTGLFPGKVGTNGQHNNGRSGRYQSTVRVNGAPGDFDDTAPALS